MSIHETGAGELLASWYRAQAAVRIRTDPGVKCFKKRCLPRVILSTYDVESGTQRYFPRLDEARIVTNLKPANMHSQLLSAMVLSPSPR
jgi:hypothetical protein